MKRRDGLQGIGMQALQAAVAGGYRAHEDRPKSTDPDGEARISGHPGEKIIQVRTRLDGSAPQWRAMAEMSAGPYVETEAMTAMAQNSVGHGRVETLVAAAAQRIYGVAGASRNGITDAIRRRADIQ